MSTPLEHKLGKETKAKLNSKDKVAFLSTADANGIPDVVVVPFFIAKDEESLLFAISKEDPCYKNLIKNKKVILSLYDDGDFCLKILGRAGVVKAPSDTHPLMNIVRLDVIKMSEDKSPFLAVHQGIRIRYKDSKASRFGSAMMKELKKVATQL